MKSLHLLIFFIFISTSANSQRILLGVFGGASAYSGELSSNIFSKKVTNGAVGLTVNYEATDNLILRGGITYSVVGGADRYSKSADLVNRNLSFETAIVELSAVGEYNLLNLFERPYTPYFFAGLAVYKFNPYAYDPGGQKTFLKPLSTEGQGLSGYPESKPYQLTQLAIPFGGGFKFALNDDLRIGIEAGLRKLFTDYLDDVSNNYIDPVDLLAAKGPKAVDMSYRGYELVGGNLNYPPKGQPRGNSKVKDYYYFAGIHISYRIGTDNSFGNGQRSQTDCPVNVY